MISDDYFDLILPDKHFAMLIFIYLFIPVKPGDLVTGYEIGGILPFHGVVLNGSI